MDFMMHKKLTLSILYNKKQHKKRRLRYRYPVDVDDGSVDVRRSVDLSELPVIPVLELYREVMSFPAVR